MAQLGATFDANTVDPQKPFELFPVCDLIAQIVMSEIRTTNDGNGQYLYLDFEVIDGEFAGRHWWERLNLWNNNEKTVQIAQETLSALCHATGAMVVDDSEALHMKPLLIKMRVGKRKDTGDPENRANYLPLPGTPMAAALDAKKPTPRAAAPAGQQRQAPPSARPAPPQQHAPAVGAVQQQQPMQPQPQQAAGTPAQPASRPWQKHRAPAT